MNKSSDQGIFPKDWPVERRVKALAAAGFDGVELNVGDDMLLPVGSSSAEAKKVRKLVESNGLRVSALRGGGLKAELSSPDRKLRAKAMPTVEWYFRTVKDLGCDAVLMIFGHVTEAVRHDQAMEIARESVKEILPVAERYGVHICIEPVWPKYGGSFIEPLSLRDFIDDIDSEYVKAYFDVGNVLVWTFPQHWIRILGERIYRVHVKDFRTDIGNIQGFTYLLHGDVPWPKVMEAFREVGYDGWLTCELPALRGDADEGIMETGRALDRIIAM